MKAIFTAVLLASSFNALAQNSVVFVPSVPTLDDVGIVGLIALVGVVGGWLARRRK
jgi:hypothetical protein